MNALPYPHRGLAGRLLPASAAVPGPRPGRATIAGGGVARTFALQAHAATAPARALTADTQAFATRTRRIDVREDRP